MIGIYRHELERMIREKVMEVLNSPIPESPRVGSIMDILKDLDERLPDRGVILTDARAYEVVMAKGQDKT